MEETNLKDAVMKMNDNLEKLLTSGKIKGVKLKGTPSKAQVKKNYIYVLYIQDNLEWKPLRVPVEEGTAVVDGIPRLTTPHYRMSYKGKPAIILPAWSSEPYNPKKEYDETARSGMLSAGYKLLLNRIEQGKVTAKKGMSGWMMFLGLIALIVVGYLAFT